MVKHMKPGVYDTVGNFFYSPRACGLECVVGHLVQLASVLWFTV